MVKPKKLVCPYCSSTDLRYDNEESIDFDRTEKTLEITYTFQCGELWLAEQNMKDIVRVLQAIGTDGKRLRLAAKIENGLTGLTMTLSEKTVQGLDCSADVIDWAAIADEYNVAKGLQ